MAPMCAIENFKKRPIPSFSRLVTSTDGKPLVLRAFRNDDLRNRIRPCGTDVRRQANSW